MHRWVLPWNMFFKKQLKCKGGLAILLPDAGLPPNLSRVRVLLASTGDCESGYTQELKNEAAHGLIRGLATS